MSEDKNKENPGGGKKQDGSRSWRSRRHGRNAATAGLAKKNPEEIPLLHFGNNNNFHKFCEALSKAALREYGHLGKLIKLEAYYSPTMPTRALLGLTDDTEEIS